MLIRGKAPLRISFSGGGTDVSPYPETHGGVVLSTTINMYAHGTLQPRDDDEINIYSLDYDVLANYHVNDEISLDGKLSLVNAVIKRMNVRKGFDLFLHCDAPPGTGMGSSGTMCALLVGLFKEFLHLPLTNYEMAEVAYLVEREDLNLLGGRQDQYAAIFGGFNLIEFFGDRTVVTPLRIEPWILRELEYHLLLCYTKSSRYSGKLIEQHVKYFEDGREDTVSAMKELKSITYEMKNALLQGTLEEFAHLLYQSGEAQKTLIRECSRGAKPKIEWEVIEVCNCIAQRRKYVKIHHNYQYQWRNRSGSKIC